MVKICGEKTYMKEICDEVWCQRTGLSDTAELKMRTQTRKNGKNRHPENKQKGKAILRIAQM